ncbi:MAG: hypothetical protein AB7F75_05125 [Planctomycetota bacterium]
MNQKNPHNEDRIIDRLASRNLRAPSTSLHARIFLGKRRKPWLSFADPLIAASLLIVLGLHFTITGSSPRHHGDWILYRMDSRLNSHQSPLPYLDMRRIEHES